MIEQTRIILNGSFIFEIQIKRACCKNRFIIEIYGYVMLVYIRVFYCFSVINQCLCVFLLYSPCVLTKNDVWSQMQTAGIYNINFYTAAADNVWKSKDFILIINGHNIKRKNNLLSFVFFYQIEPTTLSLYNFYDFSVHEKAIFVDSMKLGVFDRIHCKICSIITFPFWTGYFRQYMKYNWFIDFWLSKFFYNSSSAR